MAASLRAGLRRRRAALVGAPGGSGGATRVRGARGLSGLPGRGRPTRRSRRSRRHGEHGVVLLGRPYNIYDKGINLEIATKLREYYGANVVALRLHRRWTPGDLAGTRRTCLWSYGAKILAAAAFTRDRPKLHIIYLTNFKCGPDSYVKHYVTEASGRPFLTLQFDGHNNDAGMLTRCEAYLDSKGVLR